MKTVRIFISSPDDSEREGAFEVIESLRSKYAGKLDLQTVVWENLPITADLSFEQGLDLLRSSLHVIDLAIFVLGRTLGALQGPSVCKGGKEYLSVTERDWDYMLNARGGYLDDSALPEILVFTCSDELGVAFGSHESFPSDADKEDLEKRRTINFFREKVLNANDGRNAWVHDCITRSAFPEVLQEHLKRRLTRIAASPTRSSQTRSERLEERQDNGKLQKDFKDDVQFTVYRPQLMQPMRWQTWLAFAHRDSDRPTETDYAGQVEEQARAILGARFNEYSPARQESSTLLPRESTITIVPEVKGLDFNPPRREFVWQEPVHREEFRARTSESNAGATLRGKITFFLGALIIAEINVKVTVTENETAENDSPMTHDHGPVYRKIFASYSRRDGPIVDHFENIVATFGDRYLRDVHTLRSGEEWSAGVEQMISQADVFQLFWSSNSMRSPYVRKEWEFALSLGRPTFVRPTYWQEPFPKDEASDLPPPQLRKLHFQRLPTLPARPSGLDGVQESKGIRRRSSTTTEARPNAIKRPSKRSAPLAPVIAILLVVCSFAATLHWLLKESVPHIKPLAGVPTPIPTPDIAAQSLAKQESRQNAMALALDQATSREAELDVQGALEAYLKVLEGFPESKLARNRVESLVDDLANRTTPMQSGEFKNLRLSLVRAAQLGVDLAKLLLAENLRTMDPIGSYGWALKAADTGSAAGLNQLGTWLAHGIPGFLEPDLPKSLECFQEGAEKGFVPAKRNLAEFYISGKAGVKDETKGLALLREAVGAGDVPAMNYLGAFLTRPEPRPDDQRKNDFDEAFRLFSKARELGDMDAIGNLGVMYFKGRTPYSHKPDYVTAARLFEEGATKSNAFCMRLYAQCLNHGTGTKKDPIEAKTWFANAENAGDKKSVNWRNGDYADFETVAAEYVGNGNGG